MPRLLLITIAASLMLGLAGCQEPEPRLNAPPHGTAAVTSDLRQPYDAMIANALLADMSITDIHFVPDRPGLNTLGLERLGKLAELLERYGGAVRFSTDETDSELVEARMQSIRSFLREAGLETTTEVLVRDMPASPGMDATQAILVREAALRVNRGGAPAGGATPAPAAAK